MHYNLTDLTITAEFSEADIELAQDAQVQKQLDRLTEVMDRESVTSKILSSARLSSSDQSELLATSANEKALREWTLAEITKTHEEANAEKASSS